MPRPIIGLTTYAEETRFGRHDTFAAVLPLAYVRAVQESGGRPVLVPPDETDADVLRHLDGLILTGGSDVDPARYGASPHPTVYTRPERDRAELLLLRAALEAGLPLLGICRGMQLMVVAAGGSLHQHLPDVLGHDTHRPVDGPRYGEHPVRLAPGSAAFNILGPDLAVNSFHHQGIADPGPLTPTGWCREDDLIEVVEVPGRRFALGVQWHPEEMPDRRLFQALVAAARAIAPV
jgi:putative glutamine amidotransferase